MKYIYITVSILLLLVYCSNKKGEQNKYNYPSLGMMVESYYFDYFDYPKSINELIKYVDLRDFPNNFDSTIKKLKNNIDNIILVNDYEKLIISLGDSTLYDCFKRNPCEDLSLNFPRYINRVLCFDEDGFPITSEALTNEFIAGLKRIRSEYKNVEKVKDPGSVYSNRLVIIQFDLENGISPFCKGNIHLEEYNYFQKTEKYLKEFSYKNGLYRIIFTTPVFF